MATCGCTMGNGLCRLMKALGRGASVFKMRNGSFAAIALLRPAV